MRVAFDMTAATAGDTGISVYATELAAALEAEGVEVARFAVGRGTGAVTAPCRHLRVPLRIVHRAWQSARAPRAEHLVGPVDVVHAAGPVPPPSRRPVVAVVHDLAPLDHPALHPGRHVRDLERTLAALPGAAAVVTVSAATRHELVRRGVPGEKVAVTPNGLRRLPEADPALVPDGPFVLAVGQLVPRKGLDGLLDALSRTTGVSLVVCGPDGGHGAELRAHARRLQIDDRVTFLGRVSDAHLAGLYGAAAAVVAASVDEGFGLPLLEAMAAGAPVIATDIPAFREVGGAAARYVRVGDPGALAVAIQEVTEGGATAGCREAGRQQAAQHTWADCARATIDVYESVLR